EAGEPAHAPPQGLAVSELLNLGGVALGIGTVEADFLAHGVSSLGVTGSGVPPDLPALTAPARRASPAGSSRHQPAPVDVDHGPRHETGVIAQQEPRHPGDVDR